MSAKVKERKIRRKNCHRDGSKEGKGAVSQRKATEEICKRGRTGRRIK